MEPAKIMCQTFCLQRFHTKSVRKGRKIYDIVKRFTLEFDSHPARIILTARLDSQYNCSAELAS